MVSGGKNKTTQDDEGDDRTVGQSFNKLRFLSQDLEGHTTVKALHLRLSLSETETAEGT